MSKWFVGPVAAVPASVPSTKCETLCLVGPNFLSCRIVSP
jgi:hypothetical protein